MKSFLLHSHLAQRIVNVGISACLLGYQVRYDGKTKSISSLLNQIDLQTQWHPLCPEITFGVPRPPVKLVITDGHDTVQAIGVKDASLNVTAALNRNSQHILNSELDNNTQMTSDVTTQLQAMASGERNTNNRAYKSEIDIWLLKARSPSCGNQTTPLHNTSGAVLALADGLFTKQCRELSPLCAIFDESALASQNMTRIFYLCAYITLDIKHTPDEQLPALIRHYQEQNLLPKTNSLLPKNSNKCDKATLSKALHNAVRESSEERIEELMKSLKQTAPVQG